MKVLLLSLRSGQTLRRILHRDQAEDLVKTLEKGFRSKKKNMVFTGEDIQGNPFFVRLDEVNALEIDDFDIQDL